MNCTSIVAIVIPRKTSLFYSNTEAFLFAAVGKIDKREIEYLMARGLDENEAVSTIVRGFLNVEIDGLPPELAATIDRAVKETEQDMM